MKQLKILLSSNDHHDIQNLAKAFENNDFFSVLGHVSSDDLIFEASILQPDIIVWKIDNSKYLSVLKQLRFCCPSSHFFGLNNSLVDIDIPASIYMGLTACLPAVLSPVQIVNAVELSISADLICIPFYPIGI